ncbi:hypothetical protein GPA19_16365 [Azoarcus indigens]|uniref:Uncharacterized protein n=1 Tax=Azoarcus indigens TaxID=29545 RepID=A0A4V3BMN3_9RHOO|nr:hypothetical protein [Azoarcus indigens]NMG66521.1 hypothetical protein [Azoarcus indigens]TDN51292.1 hypothetical protein C7389_10726 [Azoarcus indigens]
MSGFGHYERDAEELEREIVKRGIVLGLDWQDENQMRELAREALTTSAQESLAELRGDDPQARARVELFGLAALMLETMRQSAEIGVHTHGGPAWKAFGHALIVESQRLGGEATH